MCNNQNLPILDKGLVLMVQQDFYWLEIVVKEIQDYFTIGTAQKHVMYHIEQYMRYLIHCDGV